MLNTNLNQFSVIRNLEDFVPNTVNFLLELEFNTCLDLQEEILNTPINVYYDIEDGVQPIFFIPKAKLIDKSWDYDFDFDSNDTEDDIPF